MSRCQKALKLIQADALLIVCFSSNPHFLMQKITLRLDSLSLSRIRFSGNTSNSTQTIVRITTQKNEVFHEGFLQ